MDSLPIIDLSLADDPEKKPKLLADLQDALFRIGFLYIVNHGAEEQAKQILEIAPKAFEIPKQDKLNVAMTKNPHFVGYTGLGAEKTAKKTDLREQYDFGSATSTDYQHGDPEWKQLRGPTPYITDHVLPGFESNVKSYIAALQHVSRNLLHLVAESLSLKPDEFDKFIGTMDRLKIVKYPPPPAHHEQVRDDLKTQQGVGPHKDSTGMFTFVLQDAIGGLEVLAPDGSWIEATPLDGSLVVNIAQGFEALTGGRCLATTHRVRAPPAGKTRYSVPFFQAVKLDLTPSEIDENSDLINGLITEGPKDLQRRQKATSSEFLDPKYSCFGEAQLRNRIISHRDVSEIWYPELKKKYLAELN